MPKRKFTEAEIIGTIHQVNAGQTCIEVVREVGVSKHTHLCLEGEVRRSARERGATAAQLEEENRRLKQLVAELSLDKEMLLSVLKKRLELADRPEVARLREAYRVSERRACGLIGVARSSCRY